MRRHLLAWTCGCLLGALAAAAQTVDVAQLECLPLEENAVITASVGGEAAGSSVHLFFRRLNPVGGFYSVQAHPSAGGTYWTTFPKPEDREQHELTDDWWEVLEDRDWMAGHDRDWLENWLEEQEYEAAEYYTAVVGVDGTVTARSETRLVEVWEEDDCDVEPLDEMQQGWAQNLTIGETTPEQQGEPVFHWLCDGIVTRINHLGIYRADEYCRACVVGYIPMAAFAAGVISGAIIEHDPPFIPEPPPPASPVQP